MAMPMCGAVNILVKIVCCQYVLEARDVRSRTNIHIQVKISSDNNQQQNPALQLTLQIDPEPLVWTMMAGSRQQAL